MAVKWQNIYRGGVQRTTPETHEANPPTAGVYLPGTAVNLTDAAGSMTIGKGPRSGWFYMLGEQMYGSVDDNQVGGLSSVRMFQVHSGDMFAGRAVAGLTLRDDSPLTINVDGRFALAGVDDTVYAYVDNPSSAYPQTVAPTVLDQLIPIKIK